MAVRAIVFDVFGTLVDWRSGVARDLARLLGPDVDSKALADAWRRRYQPALEEVRSGRRPYEILDVLHREGLDSILAEAGIAADEATRRELVSAWHRLDAWPDVGEGLRRLRERHLLAPLSNAHIALGIGLARRNGWTWDAILGAELARDYKPKAVVYRSGSSALGLDPAEVLMVAAHSDDLAAAAACGLRTAHVARPDEWGPGGGGEAAPSVPVDHAAGSLLDLADRLGC